MGRARFESRVTETDSGESCINLGSDDTAAELGKLRALMFFLSYPITSLFYRKEFSVLEDKWVRLPPQWSP